MPSCIVNAGFDREVRVNGRKKGLEHANVQSIFIPFAWGTPFKDVEMRKLIREKAPEGEGWQLSGYVYISGDKHPSARFTTAG